ncbi:hypothetical protein EHYA_10030 [Embleya hyalina]|uniref:Uncharacterized protein n=1 Tax=Embleya hyalina TaxID=516124 RepID=A0A401Z5Y2_9ACTN|nr:hypothetical protein EHYA_10030 [Embleya hyalina]
MRTPRGTPHPPCAGKPPPDTADSPERYDTITHEAHDPDATGPVRSVSRASVGAGRDTVGAAGRGRTRMVGSQSRAPRVHDPSSGGTAPLDPRDTRSEARRRPATRGSRGLAGWARGLIRSVGRLPRRGWRLRGCCRVGRGPASPCWCRWGVPSPRGRSAKTVSTDATRFTSPRPPGHLSGPPVGGFGASEWRTELPFGPVPFTAPGEFWPRSGTTGRLPRSVSGRSRHARVADGCTRSHMVGDAHPPVCFSRSSYGQPRRPIPPWRTR